MNKIAIVMLTVGALTGFLIGLHFEPTQSELLKSAVTYMNEVHK